MTAEEPLIGSRRLARWARSRVARLLLPGGLLVLGLAISLGLAHRQAALNAGVLDATVAREQQDALLLIESRMRLYELGLRSARGAVLAAGGAAVTPEAFRAYSASRDFAAEFPGSRGFGFIRRVPDGSLSEYLARHAEAQGAAFPLQEFAPHTGDHLVVEFVEPAATGQVLVGLDLASEARRLAAAEAAVASGEPQMTAPITLVQAPQAADKGVMFLLPIDGPEPAAVVGWTFAPLLLPEVIGPVFVGQGLAWRMRDVDVDDGAGAEQATWVAAGPVAEWERATSKARAARMALYGRVWEIEVAPLPGFVAALALPSPTDVGLRGALVSTLAALLALAFLTVLRRRHDAWLSNLEVLSLRGASLEKARLSAVIDGTGAGTWEWNLQTGALRINARWAEMLGLDLDALGPMNFDRWTMMIHPDDLASVTEAIERHLEGVDPLFATEMRLRHRDGHWVWVSSRGKVQTRSPDGRPHWMFGTHTDVSDQHEHREKLEFSRSMLEKMGEIAGVGGWSLEVGTKTLIWTRETRRLHGVPDDHQPGVDEAIAFYAPEVRTQIEEAVTLGISKGRDWDLELPLIRADGQRRWVRAAGRPIYEQGRLVRLVGAFHDITDSVEHRRALEATAEELRIANRRLALATSGGGIGVWEWDLRTGTQWWDEQMHRLYGVSPEFRGSHAWWAEIVHPDDHGPAMAELQRCLETPGLDYESEFRVRLPEGGWRTLKSKAIVTRDETGTPITVTGVNFDVTEQRSLEAALVTANLGLEERVAERTRQLEEARDAAEGASRAKSEFLTNMSHELRTPLHGILGFAKLLGEEGETPGPDTTRRYASHIVKNGTQLLALVDDLLDSAKIEVGNFRVHAEPGDLAAVVGAVVDEFAGRARRDVVLRLESPGQLPLIFDAKRIAQVVRNLIANAVRLSPSEGVVEVRLSERSDAAVQLQVMDRGPGIPEAELDAIFERFMQGSKTKTGAGGAGLGLAIARGIVELHGGHLDAMNREGGGAIFTLVLPPASAQGLAGSAPGSSTS